MDPLTMLMTAGGALGGGLVKAGGSRVIGAAAGAVGANLASRGSAADAVRFSPEQKFYEDTWVGNQFMDWMDKEWDAKKDPEYLKKVIQLSEKYGDPPVEEIMGMVSKMKKGYNPFTQDLPQGDTIGAQDFR